MRIALRTVAMLWLPSMLVLLGGMPALLHAGQVDLRGWVPLMLLLVLAAGVLAWRRSVVHAIWAGLGTLALLFMFAALTAERLPELVDMILLGVVALLAVAGGIWLSQRRWWGVAACAVTLVLCLLTIGRPVDTSPGPRPALGVMSGLPLFWQNDREGLPVRTDAPIISVLRQSFKVQALDSVDPAALSKLDVLLLAQPRAMTPTELVAIDAWVRAGGRALLLADPMLRWPSTLPMGDRRRPPAVSLLTPLIGHWGLRLLPLSDTGERRHFLGDGRLLTTISASGFHNEIAECSEEGEGLVARCAVGNGSVSLVADADFIDDRLWLADPTAPLDMRNWTADSAAFVAEELGARRAYASRRWVRSEKSLITGVRLAILFGTVWAIMGTVLLRRQSGAPQSIRLTWRKSIREGNGI